MRTRRPRLLASQTGRQSFQKFAHSFETVPAPRRATLFSIPLSNGTRTSAPLLPTSATAPAAKQKSISTIATTHPKISAAHSLREKSASPVLASSRAIPQVKSATLSSTVIGRSTTRIPKVARAESWTNSASSARPVATRTSRSRAHRAPARSAPSTPFTTLVKTVAPARTKKVNPHALEPSAASATTSCCSSRVRSL